MEKFILIILTKSMYDFMMEKNSDFLIKTAKSWHRTLTKLNYCLTQEEIEDIYHYGLDNGHYSYGFNLQTFIKSIKDWQNNRKMKSDRKVFKP